MNEANDLNVKLFYREADGHAYVYSIEENEWIAFPVFDTGDPDWMNPTLFSDINLNEEDLNQLKTWLEEKEKEIGVKDFDVNEPIYWKEDK